MVASQISSFREINEAKDNQEFGVSQKQRGNLNLENKGEVVLSAQGR